MSKGSKKGTNTSKASANKKTRSTAAVASSARGKPATPSIKASTAKGLKVRDRRELDKMNGTMTALHGRLGGGLGAARKAVAEVAGAGSRNKSQPVTSFITTRRTTNDLADSFARAL